MKKNAHRIVMLFLALFLVTGFYILIKLESTQSSFNQNPPNTILKPTGLVPSPIEEIRAIPFAPDPTTVPAISAPIN